MAVAAAAVAAAAADAAAAAAAAAVADAAVAAAADAAVAAGDAVAQHFYRRKRRRVHVMRKWRGKTMVEEEKMSLVWKKVEVLKILRFFATFFRRREPLLLVIPISLEWALLTVLMRGNKDEIRQKDESMSNPLRQK